MNYRGCKCLGCSSLSIWIWMEVALVNSANVCVRMFVSAFWCNLAYPSPLASIRQSLMDKHACIQKNTNWRFWIRHCLSLDSLSGSEINLYRLSSWIFFIFLKICINLFSYSLQECDFVRFRMFPPFSRFFWRCYHLALSSIVDLRVVGWNIWRFYGSNWFCHFVGLCQIAILCPETQIWGLQMLKGSANHLITLLPWVALSDGFISKFLRSNFVGMIL